MKNQKINTRKFIVGFRDSPFPSAQWHVTDNYVGESVSGGPIIALFYDEALAREYADMKNAKRDKAII